MNTENKRANNFAGSGNFKLPSFMNGKSPKAARNIEELPFFGPLDPPRWPLHKTLFLGGIVFFPLLFVGAFLEVKDTDDNWSELFRRRCQAAVMVLCIVAVALVILETGFRGS